MPATTANKRLGLKSSPVGCRTITTPKNPTKIDRNAHLEALETAPQQPKVI